MSLRETAVTSYDAGQKPYLHDPKRGKWEGKWDFYLACFANSFGMRTFFIFALFMQAVGRVFIALPIIVTLLLFIIPIFFVQSFMGQFSSTGFISVFRISPLFKGIGYVTLILNFLSTIYNSSIASYPLLFFLKSFQFNTTWMYCDNPWNSPNCTGPPENDMFSFAEDRNGTESILPIFEYLYQEVLKISQDEDAFEVSWTIILGELVIWLVVGYLLINGISMISKYLRYNVLVGASISLILFIRVCCLPEVGEDIVKFFSVDGYLPSSFAISWVVGPMITLPILGRGWGITLTLASYQPFKANTEFYSFFIPLVMTAIGLLFGFMLCLIEGFVTRRTYFSIQYFDQDSIEYLLVVLPYFFGKIEASQMWSMLFFLMFFLSEVALITIQSFCIVTALTDEYIYLRSWKRELSIALCVICFIFSMCFATSHLIDTIKALLSSGYVTQTLICFLEIMIVVWIYGRERFLRDVNFMLQRSLAGWKFYILRFVTPMFIAFATFFYVLTTLYHLLDTDIHMKVFVIFMKAIPWVFIPGYIIAKIVSTIGTIPERIRRCIRPNDWYPADPADKYKYDLALGNSDVSQQLLEMNDNNVP